MSLNCGSTVRLKDGGEQSSGIYWGLRLHGNQHIAILVFGFLVAFPSMAAAAESDAAGLEFFEKNIRPLLIEKCYKCHSHQSEKVKGGLLLDTRDGLLKGGDSGPAVIPGRPDDSLLIKAVRYTDKELQMPPKDQKLSAGQVTHLETWVKMGLPDPRINTQAPNPDYAKDKARTHWAFQPVVKPAIPSVKNKRWIQSPVDAFVLSKLETVGMTPARKADKRTLIRRATFDLIGLPPTPEEVAAFEADKSEQAFAKVVDRLLASPQYGERWGRHWLDVARYADTKGFGGGDGPRFPYSYTYRDYVIRAFNEDLPYDQFLIQQIAADQLNLTEDNRPLTAMGFLTVGRRFLNDENEIIDDRIDVVFRGTMGLTVGCARCHDHKFDPIPTRDYYSLYGVFKSSNEPGDKPLVTYHPTPPLYTNYLAERKKLEDDVNRYVTSNEVFVVTRLHSQVGDYLMAVHDTKALSDAARDELVRNTRQLNLPVYQRWQTSLKEWSKTNHGIFAPWFAFDALSEKEFAGKAKELAVKFAANQDSTNALNPFVAKLFSGEPPTEIKQVAQRYGQLFIDVDKHWQEKLKTSDSASAADQYQTNSPTATVLSDPNEEMLRQVLWASNAPANPPRDQFASLSLFDEPVTDMISKLKRNVDLLEATHPGVPPRAMVLKDNPTPTDAKVFIRGNPGTEGALAPRQFLEIVAGPERERFPTNSSGRLQLAQAIASPGNPLTARVMVNRIWLNHFGAGLVGTPGDFGVRSEPPTHPELLDYLAARFVDDGWSVKNLHRLIMLSSTYQQGCEENSRYAQIDPDNHLLWRMNRRRLDFEALRDSLLAAAARLDLTVGGRPVDIATNAPTTRRTVYSLIDRQNLPNLFRIFDFANPDTASPNRFETIVAPQALYLLNSRFVIDQVKELAERARTLPDQPQWAKLSTEERRIRTLYQLVFQRDPTPDEMKHGCSFIRTYTEQKPLFPERAAWKYGCGAYDETTQLVKDFVPFPYFTGTNWQAGPTMPDPRLARARLDAEGGHPGTNVSQSVIRRWIAPRDVTISIKGELSHNSTSGDGVHSRIVSSRTGELGHWTAFNDKAATTVVNIQVKNDETIDFVTDCVSSSDSDNFKWSSIITIVDGGSQSTAGQSIIWDSRQNFGEPGRILKPLGAWEEFAQILLMSNEFAFVD